ncbi:MAG TPA: hypothetical protein VKQ09_07235 [Sphingomonas sp.]|nr:hypothetical protein [Sphingomonas sp.]
MVYEIDGPDLEALRRARARLERFGLAAVILSWLGAVLIMASLVLVAS